MKKLLLPAIIIVSFQNISPAQFYKKDAPFAHTFSIVARDPKTGEIGRGRSKPLV